MIWERLFHINIVESLWSCIKRLSNNFSGFNFNVLENAQNNGFSPKEYLNNWIYYYLS